MKIKLPSIDLRRLILWMCLFFVLLALANNLYASYKVQREVLLQNTLDVNHVYAQKLAQITNGYVNSAKKLLEAAAWQLSARSRDSDSDSMQEDLARLARSTRTFNSLFVSDPSGHVRAAVPVADKLAGTFLRSPPSLEALERQQAYVSAPFLAPSKRWLILVSHPIYDLHGTYAGMIGGTIYLHSTNALQFMLGEHYYNDSSYVYVVDQHGLLIYHPVAQRIGASNIDNLAVQAVLRGENGTLRLVNVDGTDMLAGYAPVPTTNWGIVVQRPTQAAIATLGTLFWRTLYYSLPITLLSLLGIWWLAKLIARPLRELAEVATHLDNRTNFKRIHFINGWYFEAALIRQALLTGFSAVATRMRRLHRETETDPLTSLINRRGLESALADLKRENSPLAAITFDIDHFKVVNDTYGHTVGDNTLKAVASMARAIARGTDTVARLGGEEFIVLLPGASLEAAETFAERLRENIGQMTTPGNGQITISLGVAHYPEHTQDIDQLLHLADTALYQAKNEGRNCVRVAAKTA